MELLYVYIKDYKNLKKQDINLGGKYRFKFEEKTSKLLVEENEMFIKDFYNLNNDGAKVVGVSSIIGENGTGKSSILNFIKDNLSSGRNLLCPAVLVIRQEEKFKILSTYPDLTVNHDGFSVEVIENTNNGDIFDFGYDLRGLPDTDIIFFSNIFDGTPGGSVAGLYDLSTNGLIYEDHLFSRQQRIIERQEDNVSVFLTSDIYRQLVFITDDTGRDLLPFRLPETLVVSIYDILNNFKEGSEEFKEFNKIKKVIKSEYILEYYKSEENTVFENHSNLHINYLIAATLENLMREVLNIHQQASDLKFNFKFSSNFLLKDGILAQYVPFEERIAYFFEQVEMQVLDSATKIASLEELVKSCKIFVNFVLENRNFFYNYNIDLNSPSTLVDIYSDGKSNEDLLIGFMKLYRKTFSINRYLNFSWRNLSTGENALLNIYSRFFSLSDRVRVGSQIKNNLIIMIDEGDTYLHPAWQKKLLLNLLEFLPSVYSNDQNQRNLQLIMTTNSAIPASDFLSYNTIFLQKKGNFQSGYKSVIRDSLNDQKQTFAANIHTLLSDSFFINDGLRGDFANFKISQALKFLNGDPNTGIESDDILKLIEQIGEPLIRNSLKELFFNRYSSKIDDEIKRLTELKQKNENNK